MEIKYKNQKLEKVCTNFKVAKQKYGKNTAAKIHQRIKELRSLSDLETGVGKVGGLHVLKGDREGQYAMSLVEPYRLILIEVCEAQNTVKVIEIVDYH